MKKVISLLLSLVMLLSITAGVKISANAAMTISQAVSWANSQVGKRVGGGQCTDLVTQYWRQLGYSTYCNSGCKYPSGQGSMPPGSKMVVYNSGVTAQVGDVAVYSKGWNGGQYGHVAIVSGVSGSTLTVIEQYGSTDNLTHKNSVGYNRSGGYVLYGFIRHNGSGNSGGGTVVPTSPTLTLSTTNVSLNLNSSNSTTVSVTAGGTLPSSFLTRYTISNGNVKCSWNPWNGNTCSLNITGANIGTSNIKIELINSSTKAVLATKNISVNVTADTYTISFNANGGYGAPSAVKTNANGSVTLPTTEPYTNEVNRVTFDANGGTLPTGLKTEYKKVFDYWYDNAGNKYYVNGSTYTFKANTTLYAHYRWEGITSSEATRTNYYFLGWYDSTTKDDNGRPSGIHYVKGTSVNKDVTLYAMWGKNRTLMIGDLDGDGQIHSSDALAVDRISKGLYTPANQEYYVFVGDVDADGYLSENDRDLILQKCTGKVQYEDLPAVKAFKGITVAQISKTTYNYGEEFEYNSIVLAAQYSPTVSHGFSCDYIVSGYDPYKIGTQTITINYYQYSTTANVTVEAPKYTLNFNGNGGFVSTVSKEITYNQSYGILPTPEKDGYRFDGWYTSDTGGTKVTSSTVLNTFSNKTVYAHWTKNSFSVTYIANGGTNIPLSSTDIDYGTSYTVPDVIPKKKGYVFKGWSLINEDTGEYICPTSKLTITENETLYAIFGESPILDVDSYEECHVLSSSYPAQIRFIAPRTAIYQFASFGATGLTPTIKLGNVTISKINEINDSDGFVFSAKLTEGQVYTIYVSAKNADTYFGLTVNNAKDIEHVHSYQKTSTTRATTEQNGKICYTCSFCGTKKTTTVYAATLINLSATSYTYNGKVKTPTVTVKNRTGKTLVKNTDYTVSYAKGRKYVGKYAVKVTFKGKYSGTKTLYFTIKPKATSIKSLSAGSKKFTVKWYKRTTQTTGYQVQYSTNSKFTSPKTVTISKTGTTSKTISKLKAKKKYYVRVRTYKTVNGTKYYSSWSKAKYVTTKS